MFGFVFGTACLAGLLYMLRRRRWYSRHHHGRWGWRGMLRGLFLRLDTSPGQEKVLVEAVEEVMQALEKLRPEGEATLKAVAQALRGESFDSTPLNELDARHEALIAELRRTLRAALSRVHEALDMRQRRELSEMLEHGAHWGSRAAWAYARHGGWGCRGHGGWGPGHGGCGWRSC